MENTNKTIATPMKAEQLFTSTLAEVLNTGDMDIPPKSQRDNSTPFLNLEEQRIRNACKRDRDFQDGKAKEFAIAPQIIEQYCNGEIDYETAIAQIMAKCHRGRTCAILNIENSAPIYAHL